MSQPITCCLCVHISQSLVERHPDVTISRCHVTRPPDGHIYSVQDMVSVILRKVVLSVRLDQLEVVKLILVVNVVFARGL